MPSLFLLFLALVAPVVDHPGTTANAAIVIGLHGRGDTPENFAGIATSLGPQLHWLVPRGPLPWGQGLVGAQWFDLQVPDGGKAALQTALDVVASQVRAAGKKPVALVGFSQGCMLAAQYAAAHPDQLRAVLCFGGRLVGPIAVPQGHHAVQIRFVHGRKDPMVPLAKAVDAVATLRKAGLNATLTEHDGGHTMPPQLMPELRAWLADRLK